MNQQQAIDLVQKTFRSGFEKQHYLLFLKNLLNQYDEEGTRTNQGARIPDKFQNYVEKLERVGKYLVDDHEVMLFIVYLKNDTSIERARTMQRNFVAWYLQDGMKDAALVAFVSSDPADWRFSFIKMEYRYDEQSNKIKEEFTPAKRWSFLVGAHEASHTAQRKLVPLMADDEYNPTLAQLEEAFNIEKVTKEFFEKYRALFTRTKQELDTIVEKDAQIKADFESKGIDTVNFAKKLLGQIVFLYYLQKKGWFGVPRGAKWGEGSRNFLRELFNKKHATYENFFNDILEPLFYEVLRVGEDRAHNDYYYSPFKCKIPFLNGGLFDPMNNYDWVNTDILLSNELFHNQNKTSEGDIGDGILDVFDRYNFTVKEDEPFEKEVAIDPELLGKAYEKFNAIRPDNFAEFQAALTSGKGEENKFNKQYGVYYTPREIVHYMCQQSIINYLHSELNQNPAYQRLGDGNLDMFGNTITTGQLDLTVKHHLADAVSKEDIETLILRGEQIKEHDERVLAEGRETRDYPFLMPLSIRNNVALIDEKLAAIKVCDPAVGSGAFPVGMMSEIVRAREVLKIWTRTEKTIYDFKRQCIENSLYGVDIDLGAVEIAKLRLWLSLIVDEDDIQNIKPLPNLDYKIVCGNSLVGFPEKGWGAGWGEGWGSNFEKEIETLIHQHFGETNPTKKDKLKNQIDEKIKSRYKNSLKAFGYQVNFDFKTVFSEVFRLQGGFDIITGNPPYIFSRERITKEEKDYYNHAYTQTQFKINTYILFVEKGRRLLKETGCLSYIIPNNWLTLETASEFRSFILSKTFSVSVVNIIDKVFESASVDNSILIFKKTGKNEINIFELKNSEFKLISTSHPNVFLNSHNNMISYESQKSDAHSSLCAKIFDLGKPLENLADVKNGIQAYTVGEGTPVQTEKMKLNRVYHSLEKKDATWQKYVDGVDVERYRIGWSRQFVKYGKNLSRPRTTNLFFGERLLVRQIPAKPPYSILSCYVNENLVNDNNSMIVINPKFGHSIKYILGLLNSRLISFWFVQTFGKMQRKVFPQFKVKELRVFPIRNIDFVNPTDRSLHESVVKIADSILTAKHNNALANTSKQEEEIDQLVYQLYGLTEDEVKIIEGK